MGVLSTESFVDQDAHHARGSRAQSSRALCVRPTGPVTPSSLSSHPFQSWYLRQEHQQRQPPASSSSASMLVRSIMTGAQTSSGHGFIAPWAQGIKVIVSAFNMSWMEFIRVSSTSSSSSCGLCHLCHWLSAFQVRSASSRLRNTLMFIWKLLVIRH